MIATTRMLVAARDDDPDRLKIYAELAGALLDRASLADRVAVAELLADFTPAPRAILRRMARDDRPVAAPILARAASLTTIDLLGLLGVVPQGHAELIARRPGLSQDVKLALINRGEVETTRALMANPAFVLTAEFADAIAAMNPDDPQILAALRGVPEARLDTVKPLFSALDAAARAKIIATVEARRTLAPRLSRPPFRIVALNGSDIFALAIKKAWSAIAARLAETLRVDEPRVAASLEDSGGEPLLVLLRAAGLTAADAMRVLLFHPMLGQNVAGIRWLGEMNERLTPEGALLLVDDWRGREGSTPPRESRRVDEPAEGVVRPTLRPGERPADRTVAAVRARTG